MVSAAGIFCHSLSFLDQQKYSTTWRRPISYFMRSEAEGFVSHAVINHQGQDFTWYITKHILRENQYGSYTVFTYFPPGISFLPASAILFRSCHSCHKLLFPMLPLQSIRLSNRPSLHTKTFHSQTSVLGRPLIFPDPLYQHAVSSFLETFSSLERHPRGLWLNVSSMTQVGPDAFHSFPLFPVSSIIKPYVCICFYEFRQSNSIIPAHI